MDIKCGRNVLEIARSKQLAETAKWTCGGRISSVCSSRTEAMQKT